MNLWKSLRGLPGGLWVLAGAQLVNRAGSMILPFRRDAGGATLESGSVTLTNPLADPAGTLELVPDAELVFRWADIIEKVRHRVLVRGRNVVWYRG